MNIIKSTYFLITSFWIITTTFMVAMYALVDAKPLIFISIINTIVFALIIYSYHKSIRRIYPED